MGKKPSQAEILGRPDLAERFQAHRELKYAGDAFKNFSKALDAVIKGFHTLLDYEKALTMGKADLNSPDKRILYAVEVYGYDKAVLKESLAALKEKSDAESLIESLEERDKSLVRKILG